MSANNSPIVILSFAMQLDRARSRSLWRRNLLTRQKQGRCACSPLTAGLAIFFEVQLSHPIRYAIEVTSLLRRLPHLNSLEYRQRREGRGAGKKVERVL